MHVASRAPALPGRPGWIPMIALLVTLCATAIADDAVLEPSAALPDSVARFLDADPFPEATLDPSGRYLLEVHKRGLLPLRNLSDPMVTVAGLRINPVTRSRHAPLPYFALSVVDVWTGVSRRVQLPPNRNIGFPAWSPDGTRYAFTVTVDTGVELWVGTSAGTPPRKVVGPQLNAARNSPCTWMPDGERLLCRMVVENGDSSEPTPPLLSQGLEIGGRFAPRRDRNAEERLVTRYLTARLELINVVSGHREPIGKPAVLESVDASPNGEYFLVARAVPPYARRLAGDPIPRSVEIWDRSGALVRTLDLQASDTEDGAPRAPHWHASRPATLIWVVAQAGGDRVMAQTAPFTAAAEELFRTPEKRFAGITWLEASDLGLVSEYDALARITRLWLIDVAAPREPKLLGSRNVDAAFPSFGRPLIRHNTAGKPVVRVHRNHIYVRGQELAGAGRRDYLDRLDLDSLTTSRHWQSETHGHETVLDVITADGNLLLTRYQSSREPPNYRVRNVPAGTVRAVTQHAHPAPALQDAQRLSLRYEREDGVQLSATLYVPPGHEPDERLPLVMWAYPKEYRPDSPPSARAASERFLDIDRAFKLFFLLRGYAVMDDVSMPVVGHADANDTFVEQIVANARAAIAAAEATGMVDPSRVGVAGHSYGAFMVANLLAHSQLFQAGAALSGAYNRTLTPFGFQTERRTLWEARDTYLQMSPFFFSHQIEAPLLLVHGLRDDNAGTSPMQSQYLYEAIQRNGGQAELVLLPLEGHLYRGRESVLDTAHTMLSWFDAFVKAPAKTTESASLAPYVAIDQTAPAERRATP